MSIHKKDIPHIQKLEKIRQELSLSELSGISNSEYSSIISKQNKELLSLLESSVSFESKAIPVSELFDVLQKCIDQPICIFNASLEIVHHNKLWENKFSAISSVQQIINLLSQEEKIIFKKNIRKVNQDLKQSMLQLRLDNSYYSVSLLPLQSADCSVSCVMIWFEDVKSKTVVHFDIEEPGNSIVQETNPDLYSIPDYKSPELYKTLLEALDGFYLVTDTSLIIKDISTKVFKKLGFNHNQLIGKSLKYLLDESSLEEFDNLFSQYSAGTIRSDNSSENVLEVLLKDNQGNLSTYELLLAALNISGKDNNLLITLFTDVQKRKDKEIEHYVARIKAEENDRTKSDFLANMSHEIRTPLNGIIGFSTMLEREDLTNEKREKYLHIIHSSTHQLLTMINDIIDISKIEASKLKIELRKADLHQILDDLYVIFNQEKQRLSKDGIKLKKSFDYPDKNFILKTDEIRLKQVLGNLLSNALKFTEKGEICFGYTLTGNANHLRFFVRDTGLGIPKSMQKMIFSRYKQTDEGAKFKYKGTGLGLAISQGIVELMGGRLELNSDSNKGSEFYFTIPLVMNNPEKE
jgi:PAS domain S-box-containing protein